MASKFADFLKTNSIDPRRILVASRQSEKLRPEDRKLRLTKRQSKGSDKAEGAEAPAKGRSGRPVTRLLLDQATEGKTISGPAKTRSFAYIFRPSGLRGSIPFTAYSSTRSGFSLSSFSRVVDFRFPT